MMEMFENGPRLTGSAGHKKFLHTVTQTLTDIGFVVKQDEMKFPRWDVSNYSLVIHGSDGIDEIVEVAYPFVRSGLTPDEGFTLPLEKGAAVSLSSHIAVTTGSMTVLGPLSTCDLQTVALKPNVKAAICCIKNEPHVQLKGTYQPFTPGLMKPALPTLMVAEDECKKVNAALTKGLKATLILKGTQDQDTTSHVWGVLPVQSIHPRCSMCHTCYSAHRAYSLEPTPTTSSTALIAYSPLS
jgi:hypothetical protein